MAKPGRPRKIHDAEAFEENIVHTPAGEIAQDNSEPEPQPVVEGVADEVQVLEESAGGFIEHVIEIPVPHVSEDMARAALDYVTEVNTGYPIHNWEPISSVPRNGFPVKLTDDVSLSGVVAFWRKSRAFANATHRWEETGFWTNSETGKNINFTPLWWKDRYAV